MELFLTYVFGELNYSASTFIFLSVLFSLLSLFYFFVLGDKKQNAFSLSFNVVFFIVFILSALVNISGYSQVKESKEYLCFTVTEKLFSKNEHKRANDILGYQCQDTKISEMYFSKELSDENMALNMYESLSVNQYFKNDLNDKKLIMDNTKKFLDKTKESDYFSKSIDKDTIKLIYKILNL